MLLQAGGGVYYASDPTALSSFTMVGGGVRSNNVPSDADTFGGEGLPPWPLQPAMHVKKHSRPLMLKAPGLMRPSVDHHGNCALSAGGVFIQTNNFSLEGIMFTNNGANLGGSLFVAANLTTRASLSHLMFANDDRAVRGEHMATNHAGNGLEAYPSCC